MKTKLSLLLLLAFSQLYAAVPPGGRRTPPTAGSPLGPSGGITTTNNPIAGYYLRTDGTIFYWDISTAAATNAQPPSTWLTNISNTGAITNLGSNLEQIQNIDLFNDGDLMFYVNGTHITNVAVGAVGTVLTSIGTGQVPTWQTPSGGISASNQTWHVWIEQSNTNYFAFNADDALILSSNDWSGLMQNVMNRTKHRHHIYLYGAHHGGAFFVSSNTITITNQGVIHGIGNPSCTIQIASGKTHSIFDVGVGTATGGINRFEGIRFEGVNGSTTATGIKFSNSAEPIITDCEFNQFPFAGVWINNPSSSHWSYSESCWFSISGGIGILIDTAPSTDSEIFIYDNFFGLNSSDSRGIVFSNLYEQVSVQGNRFDSASGATGIIGIDVVTGRNLNIGNNTFREMPNTAIPINFRDLGAAYNIDSLVANNLVVTNGVLLSPTNMIYIGNNVQGVTLSGNRNSTPIANSSVYVLGGNNGNISSWDNKNITISTNLYLGNLTPDRFLYLDTDGKVIAHTSTTLDVLATLSSARGNIIIGGAASEWDVLTQGGSSYGDVYFTDSIDVQLGKPLTLVYTNSTSTNFITDVAELTATGGAEMIPIVDTNGGVSRKFIRVGNLTGSVGEANTWDDLGASNLSTSYSIVSNKVGAGFQAYLLVEGNNVAMDLTATGIVFSVSGIGTTIQGYDAQLDEWGGISTNKNMWTNSLILVGGSGGVTVSQIVSNQYIYWTINDDDAGGGGIAGVMVTNDAPTAQYDVGVANSTTGTNIVYTRVNINPANTNVTGVHNLTANNQISAGSFVGSGSAAGQIALFDETGNAGFILAATNTFGATNLFYLNMKGMSANEYIKVHSATAGSGGTNYVVLTNAAFDLVNADINASAGIVYTKLDPAIVITNATGAQGTNFIANVADVGTPASGDLIPIVDISESPSQRKYVQVGNLPAGSPTPAGTWGSIQYNSNGILFAIPSIAVTNISSSTLDSRLGIGTNAPKAGLHMLVGEDNDAGGTQTYMMFYDNGTYKGIQSSDFVGTQSDVDYAFMVNDNTRWRFLSSSGGYAFRPDEGTEAGYDIGAASYPVKTVYKRGDGYESDLQAASGNQTNYLFNARTSGHVWINGNTNVNFSAITNGTTDEIYFCNFTITNLSSSTPGIGFAAGTNRWKWSYAQGGTAPSIITNGTALIINCQVMNTNIIASYAYVSWP